MKKGLTILVLVLALVGGFFVWQKMQAPQTVQPVQKQEPMIKKIDLTTQPEWVQKLVVTAKKGTAANGLSNITIKAVGLPKEVSAVSYVFSYETAKNGTQGHFSNTPLETKGQDSFTKTIELGTCSTKSCVRHEGVTAVEIELDFTTSSDDSPIWTGTISL